MAHHTDTKLNAEPETDNAPKLTAIHTNLMLNAHAYERLKDFIASLDVYVKGVDLRLKKRKLSDQFGISRTPVREALIRLEQEALVTIRPRQGVYIQRKSLSEILEIITECAALESMAARLAVQTASDEEVGKLRKMASKYDGTTPHARIDDHSEDNQRFHRSILELSGCDRLIQTADSLFIYMPAVRNRATAESNPLRRSAVDHMQIIKAI